MPAILLLGRGLSLLRPGEQFFSVPISSSIVPFGLYNNRKKNSQLELEAEVHFAKLKERRAVNVGVWPGAFLYGFVSQSATQFRPIANQNVIYSKLYESRNNENIL